MSADPRLPELFERASSLVGEERTELLTALALAEPALARELEGLLAAAPAGERLEVPAWRQLALDPPVVPSPSPLRVGPYRLLREIGHGGMGRVFLAEQEVEAFRRQVALKLLDRPAATTDEVRRFRDEVRILAGLEHPGIARFLDGGQSPEGIWFLALEYVDGMDLVEHARRARLDVAERLGIFLAVLEVVEYAHRNGIVHRDLKPSNILVGTDGRPRLLDFGIAKLVDPEDGGGGTVTRTEARALTPAYASPEQFRGERATASSDVYSLGVVLYELLAGRRPFGEDSTPRAALERAVLEQEPVAPSAGAADDRATTRPGAGPRRRFGRGLDAICLKALAKDPAARYASVAAFADDLRRHLEGRPVDALRGDRRHRLARFFRRQRGRLVVAAALAVAAGALVLPRFERSGGERVTAPRPFPLQAADRIPIAELERHFAAAPEDLVAGVALVTGLLRAGRAGEAAVMVGRLRQVPGAEGDPLLDYAEAMIAVHRDEPQRALAHATRALQAALAAGRSDLLARIRGLRGRVLSELGQREEAVAELEAAVGEAEAAGDDDTLARMYNDLGVEAMSSGDFALGERRFEAALAAADRAGDVLRAGAVGHNLAGIAAMRGEWAKAERRFRAAATTFRELDSPRRLGISLGDLGNSLRELGRASEALPVLDEAITLLREVDDDTSLAFALSYRAEIDLATGRLEAVATAADEIEARAQASGSRTALGLAERLRGLRAAADGEPAAARRRLEEAVRVLAENGETDLAAMTALELGETELELGDSAGARGRAASVLDGLAASSAGDLAFEAGILLARADARDGRADDGARRLISLGPGAERRESVRVRIRFLRARAELAATAGDVAAAAADLGAAARAAREGGRALDAFAAERVLAALAARRQGTVALQPPVDPPSNPPQ